MTSTQHTLLLTVLAMATCATGTLGEASPLQIPTGQVAISLEHRYYERAAFLYQLNWASLTVTETRFRAGVGKPSSVELDHREVERLVSILLTADFFSLPSSYYQDGFLAVGLSAQGDTLSVEPYKLPYRATETFVLRAVLGGLEHAVTFDRACVAMPSGLMFAAERILRLAKEAGFTEDL